ncbi:MAG: hypothetical protein MR024_02400 [Firmicutes bacterium]|nr:hypothetical protein [Bacillota bacterium]
MKTTFVFTGKRNYKKILEGFQSKVNLSTYDYDILFLDNELRSNTSELGTLFPDLSFKIMIFDNYSTENEMVEYLFQNQNLNDVIIVKSSYENINFEDFNNILKEASKGRDIVVSKQNKQANFFSKVWKNIKKFVVRYLFGFKMYNSEADIIYLSPLAVSIVKQSPKRSAMFTKMNAWAGLEAYEVLIMEQPKQKSEIKLSKNYLLSLISAAAVFLEMIVGNILFSVLNVKLPFLAMLSYILVEVLIFGFFTFYGLKALFIKKYGKLNFINEAILTQTIDNTL